MIFKTLFAAKHKSNDPQVRIESIAKLELSKPADKQILHELAFNDSSSAVILAALDKLNSFPLWLKASETSDHKSVKNKAFAKVTQELNDPDSVLISEQDFIVFCKELSNFALLEKLILNNPRLQKNDDLLLLSLERLNKDNVSRMYFKMCSNKAQRTAIVDSMQGANELNKLLKQCDDEQISRLIQQKLDKLKASEAKPLQIKQHASLISSKLLASKELHNYELLAQTQEQLVAEFEAVKVDFNWLDEDSACQIAEKFLTVNEGVEKRLKSLKESWLQQQKLTKITDDIANIETQINEVIVQIDALTFVEDLSQLHSQSKLLNLSLADARANLSRNSNEEATTAQLIWIERLKGSVGTQLKRLENLPAICELNALASQIINAFSADTEKSDIGQIRAQWKHDVEQSRYTVNKSLIAQWRALNKEYNAELKVQAAISDRAQKQVFAKLKTVQRLIDQGKFKPAIASFAYAEKGFVALDEIQRNKISKIFQEVSQKVTELQDLQAFIAAPRKPALMEEARQLCQQPANNINERAAAVKHLRSQWLSLGQLNTDEDSRLNTEFDLLVESAFKPCRDHFAEQEKIRSANKQLADGLLQTLSDLQAIEEPQVLAKEFTKTQRAWRALGTLEHNDFKSLQIAYKQACEPVTKRVDTYYKENFAAKTRLLNKALSLAEHEKIEEAVSIAKTLQVEWKSVGYAGHKHDDKLWKQFRAANDAVFTRLSALNEAFRNEQKAKAVELEQGMQALNNDISDATDLSSLDELQSKSEHLADALNQLEDKQKRHYANKLDKVQSIINSNRKAIRANAGKQELTDLFTVLESWRDADLPDNLEHLSAKNQSLFKNIENVNVPRKELVIQAEIISDIDSPDGDQTARKEIQLNLMALRLEGGVLPTLEDILKQWISFGPLNNSDLDLLHRLANIYGVSQHPLSAPTELEEQTQQANVMLSDE